jgi:hypothetical protein
MANFEQSAAGTTPPYAGTTWNDPTPDKLWSVIRDATGQGATDTFLFARVFKADLFLYSSCHRIALATDMSSLTRFRKAVSATWTIRNLDTTPLDSFGGDWSDANKGLVLTLMDESVKGSANLGGTDYNAMFDDFTEVSNAIPFSSIDGEAGDIVFTLNQAGLDYLDTVFDKANYPGNAYFGLAVVGDVRDVEPGGVGGSLNYSFKHVNDGSPFHPKFNMEYIEFPEVYINIGDSWKEVLGMEINIGDSWKAVSDIEINIGDSWETD